MSQCIACHDTDNASAECDVCHSEDVGVAVRRLQRPFAQTLTGREDCRGCHEVESCNDCHGLELPHSQEFIDGYHARPALVETSTCLKCHDIKAFCNGCHEFKVDGYGATSWQKTHQNLGDFTSWHANSRGPGLGACRCHDSDRQRFCDYCHGELPPR